MVGNNQVGAENQLGPLQEQPGLSTAELLPHPLCSNHCTCFIEIFLSLPLTKVML